jgi:hypothetical protein
MKVKDLGRQADEAYMQSMVAQISNSFKPAISEIQCDSTRKILERPISEDKLWQSRPLPTYEGQPDAIREAWCSGSIRDYVDSFHRRITPEEYALERDIRGKRDLPGASTERGVSYYKIEMAEQAFIFTPPADPKKEDIDRLQSIHRYQAIVAEVLALKEKPLRKKTLLEKFFGLFGKTEDLMSWRDYRD